MDTNQKTSKKKTSKFFENYILRLLNCSHENSNITADSRQQLNSILCIISKLIAAEARSMTEFSKKKTIAIDEVQTAIRIIFPEKIASKMCTTGIAANSTFITTDISSDKMMSKQNRAGISVPPSLVDKFLRDFGNYKIQVTSSAPVFFAGAIEELIIYILSNAVKISKANKHIRITVRDIEVSIQEDTDLFNFFHKHNIMFFGGGNIPYIHESLLVKRPRKRAKVKENKNHRFRPGTVSIREIKKAQNASNHLVFAKSTFEQYIRDKVLLKAGRPEKGIMIRKDVFTIIQFFIEQQIVDLLKSANFAAIHANRLKVIPEDISFVKSLFNGTCGNIQQSQQKNTEEVTTQNTNEDIEEEFKEAQEYINDNDE